MSTGTGEARSAQKSAAYKPRSARYAHQSELTPEQRQWIGQRVTQLRGQVAIREFARRCGLADRTVRRLEAGGVDPSLGTLMAIVRGARLYSVEEVLAGQALGTALLADISVTAEVADAG